MLPPWSPLKRYLYGCLVRHTSRIGLFEVSSDTLADRAQGPIRKEGATWLVELKLLRMENHRFFFLASWVHFQKILENTGKSRNMEFGLFSFFCL